MRKPRNQVKATGFRYGRTLATHTGPAFGIAAIRSLLNENLRYLQRVDNARAAHSGPFRSDVLQ